jgi:hypothetical protein
MVKIRKRRETTKKADVLGEPGRAILPEDLRWINGHSRLQRQPARRPAPKIVGVGSVPRSDVESRLLTAMKTLRALPDRERRFFVAKSSSPDYVRDYIDAYDPDVEIMPRFQPTPKDVSDCLTALSWVRHLDKPVWQILWWRSFDISFGLIAKYIGRSDEAARKRYENAVMDAWIAANTP